MPTAEIYRIVLDVRGLHRVGVLPDSGVKVCHLGFLSFCSVQCLSLSSVAHVDQEHMLSHVLVEAWIE